MEAKYTVRVIDEFIYHNMSQTRCVICGAHESDVEKLHYFPTNPKKLKLWQEIFGITYEGACLRNRRICSTHFSDESYVNLITRRLNKDAVPIQESVSHGCVNEKTANGNNQRKTAN